MKKILAILVAALLCLSAVGYAAIEDNPNYSDFVFFENQDLDLNTYYNELDPELNADITIRGTGPVIIGGMEHETPVPKANEEYVIGFSTYYTVDEVCAAGLAEMERLAEEAGVKLLVNDANYDQDAQNQAVEQWILEGVDGIIIAPCDFYGVKGALDLCADAGIPVMTTNPPLAGAADAIFMNECITEGRNAGQLLLDHLLAEGVEMKGTIVYLNLSFLHPNAVLRAQGFCEIFADYPEIEIVELTGDSPEEAYTNYESALMSYGDELIGAWGLYSSATVGMINAARANDSKVPITSIDNDKYILEAIYLGDILGSATYSSTSGPYWILSAMVNHLNGVEVPRLMFNTCEVTTKENVEEMFEIYYPGKTLADYMAGLVD